MYPLLGEDMPVTYQVGLCGYDGVVLASDRRVIEWNRQTVGTRNLLLSDKIVYSQDEGWAYCCAGGESAIAAMQNFFNKSNSVIQNHSCPN
jgi:hypothetical protein